MKRRRFSENTSSGFWKESEAGQENRETCRKHGINEQTFYRWRSKYGGMSVSDVRRLKDLEVENRVKQLLAEAHLDNVALKDLLRKKSSAAEASRGYLVAEGLLSWSQQAKHGDEVRSSPAGEAPC